MADIKRVYNKKLNSVVKNTKEALKENAKSILSEDMENPIKRAINSGTAIFSHMPEITTNSERVKNRLKQILDNRGIKQVWLAEQVGVTKQTMSNIISNRYNTSLEVAFKIAIILKVKVDDIFYYE